MTERPLLGPPHGPDHAPDSIMRQFQSQLAYAFQVPVDRLFGGGGGGDEDMRSYYAAIEARLWQATKPAVRINVVLLLRSRKRNKRRPRFAQAVRRRQG